MNENEVLTISGLKKVLSENDKDLEKSSAKGKLSK